jgi:RHS repeat-associated protein
MSHVTHTYTQFGSVSSRQQWIEGENYSTNSYEYDELYRTTSVTDANGNTFRTTYDRAGRLTAAEDAACNKREYVRDRSGNVIESRIIEKTPGQPDKTITVRHDYDELSRRTRSINQLGHQTRYAYDSVSNLVQTVDAEGTVTQHSYNGLKRRTQMLEDADGLKHATRYDYDPTGRLLRVTDAKDYSTIYEYDPLGRQTAITYADGSAWHLNYDSSGNVVELVDPNGSKILSRFDSLDRRIEQRVIPVKGVIGTTLRTFDYDGRSRLIRATDNNGTGPNDDSVVLFKYDGQSRLITDSQLLNSDSKTVSYSYDVAGKRKTLTYPDGKTLTYARDDLNRIISIGTMHEGWKVGPVAAFSYSGRYRTYEQRYFGSAEKPIAKSSFEYDTINRLTRIEARSGDNALLVGFSYGYDKVGNKLWEESLHAPENSQTLQYDALYRLTKFETGPLNDEHKVENLSTTESWTLDPVHNWSSWSRRSTADSPNPGTRTSNPATSEPQKPEPLNLSPSDSRTHNSIHQITSINDRKFTYDRNGNLSADGQREFHWDAYNRLVKVTHDKNVVVEYKYDALGRRILKKSTVDSARATDKHRSSAETSFTRFVHSGFDVVAEYSGLRLEARYILGRRIDEVLVMERRDIADLDADGDHDEFQTFYYDTNHLGTVAAISWRDEDADKQRVVESYSYSAFGRAKVRFTDPSTDRVIDTGLSRIGNPYTFTGRRYDPETRLMFFRTRYFSTDFGRFISRDSLGYVDGLNLYAGYFVPNSIDPKGEVFWGPIAKAAYAAAVTLAPRILPALERARMTVIRNGAVGAHFGRGMQLLYDESTEFQAELLAEMQSTGAEPTTGGSVDIAAEFGAIGDVFIEFEESGGIRLTGSDAPSDPLSSSGSGTEGAPAGEPDPSTDTSGGSAPTNPSGGTGGPVGTAPCPDPDGDIPWGQYCESGCEDVANAIQNLIGGTIHTIVPRAGLPNLGLRNGQPTYWPFHKVVVKDGKVYDALTGRSGQTVSTFKRAWDYADDIIFGF